MGHVKRIWYLSHMRAAKVQASLRIRAVSPEPPLLAHTTMSQEEPSDRKPDPWPLWMAGHAQLKFIMTECSKTQIGLTRHLWAKKSFVTNILFQQQSKYKVKSSIFRPLAMLKFP